MIISGCVTPPFCLPDRIRRVCSQTRSGRSGGHNGECRRSAEKKKQLQGEEERETRTLHINKLHETSVKKRGRGLDGESRRIPRLPCCHRQPLFCCFLPSQRQRRGGSSQESPTDTVKRWCSGDSSLSVFFFCFIFFGGTISSTVRPP